eukprot:SAG31_NODE_177_length_21310_cov_8.894064_1_plen_174_part_00
MRLQLHWTQTRRSRSRRLQVVVPAQSARRRSEGQRPTSSSRPTILSTPARVGQILTPTTSSTRPASRHLARHLSHHAGCSSEMPARSVGGVGEWQTISRRRRRRRGGADVKWATQSETPAAGAKIFVHSRSARRVHDQIVTVEGDSIVDAHSRGGRWPPNSCNLRNYRPGPLS